jgi:hypothetical protein
MPELTNSAIRQDSRPQEVDKFRVAFWVAGDVQES